MMILLWSISADWLCVLPAGGKEVVISRKAGESVMRGAQPFLPGCLAASSGLEAGDTVAVSLALCSSHARCTQHAFT